MAAQLGADTVTLRGSLARASLRLSVVPGLSALEGYAWVAEALHAAGSGIVYVLTVAETQRLAAFLPNAAGRGRVLGPDRESRGLEDRLRANQIKALIATSALGMGYDKPDLAFASIWARRRRRSPTTSRSAAPAGRWRRDRRAGPGPSDNGSGSTSPRPASPTDDQVERILDALATARRSRAVEAATGIRRGRLRRCSRSWRSTRCWSQSARGGRRPGEKSYFDEPKSSDCGGCAPRKPT